MFVLCKYTYPKEFASIYNIKRAHEWWKRNQLIPTARIYPFIYICATLSRRYLGMVAYGYGYNCPSQYKDDLFVAPKA